MTVEAPARPKRRVATEIPLDRITPDPDQPRKVFDQQALDELAASLASEGLLQPITIKPAPESTTRNRRYVIIAGERRYRAARSLEWDTIAAIVRKDVSDGEAAKLQLLENIVREDLNPIEEARAMQRMVDAGYTVKELADCLGVDPSRIPWRIEMLSAPEELLALVEKGTLAASIAWQVTALSPAGQQQATKILRTRRLSYGEVVTLCNEITANENQEALFEGLVLSEPQQQAVHDFEATFATIGRALAKLERMEQDTPGLLATALEARSAVIESQIKATTAGLERVRKAIRDGRVRKILGQEGE